MSRFLFAIGLTGCLCQCALLRADVFFLSSGGRVEGELLNPEESPRQTYVLKTALGGKLTLASRQVERVVVKSEAEKRYEAFVATLPDTVQAHLDTARRCEKAGLNNQRAYHMEQVLRLDPSHEEARHALGYSKVDGEWIRADEFMRRKGYVRYANSWRLPQDVAQQQAAEAEEKQIVEWRKKIRMWREMIVKNRERAAEGRAEILHIREPIAVPVLIEQLNREKEPQTLRLLYIDTLGEIGGTDTLVIFVRLALHDGDSQIREACLDRLVKTGSKGAVRQFIKALASEDNGMVQRAAYALERMNDPEATLPLIEALITEHKVIIGGSQMTPTFSGDGSAGLGMGGGQKVVKVKKSNEPVLRALSTINVGVNYGFDQARWKAWFIEQNRPKSAVSLRRSK